MTITVTNYVTDYWILDNIIDCSEIIEEKLNNSNHEYVLLPPEDESRHSADTNKKCDTNKYYIRNQPCQENKKSHFNALKNINTYNNNKVKKICLHQHKITKLLKRV